MKQKTKARSKAAYERKLAIIDTLGALALAVVGGTGFLVFVYATAQCLLQEAAR